MLLKALNIYVYDVIEEMECDLHLHYKPPKARIENIL